MKPDSAEANKHHTESHLYKSDKEFFDDILGKGIGDPDVHGHYPGEPEQATCVLCNKND